MSTLSAARAILGLALVASSLSACAGSGAHPVVPYGSTSTQAADSPRDAGAASLPHVTLAAKAPMRNGFRPDRGGSWVAKGAASGALLYLSDINANDVYVYSWPTLKQVGTLTGFNGPQGLCVDKSANVWIANTLSSQLLEFAHGGTSPIGTLSTHNQYPVSCAVNQKTGELAAGSIESTSLGQGGVTLFKNESGNGTFLMSPDVYYVYFLGYGADGTLFIDGHDSNHIFAFDSLSRGTFTPITISGGTVNFPGGIQFNRGTLTLGDQLGSNGYSIVYGLSVSGATATITAATALTRSLDCVQYTIRGRRIVCPDASGGIYEVYAYPAGGLPTKLITGNFSVPSGSVVSP